jgi:hypothetical protein
VLRYLKNLTSTQTFEGEPWKFDKLSSVPQSCIDDKAARTAWANLSGTDYMFYSGFVAVNENMRVSERGLKDNDNRPWEMRAFVGDYDAKFTEQEVDSAIARMDIKPNWVERSLSGNWRLVWIFAVPIALSSRNFAVHLLKQLHEFLPILQLSNLDVGYLEPSRYYTAGSQWRQIEPDPIPHATVCGWLLKVCRTYAWKDNEPGVTIPAKIVADRFRELSDKFPRFKEWEGDFDFGLQGPSFWIEGSTSKASAMVCETGMKTFAAHAGGKGWWTWPELLGADWVKQFEQNRTGNAVKDIYFDGKDYGVKRESGRWDILNKDNVINELVVMRGLTRDISKKKGETFSEVEGAIAFIHGEQRVKGMKSFAFWPKGKIPFNSEWYINTHNVDAMSPADGKAVWGPEGQFPWISEYYDNFFTTPDQLPFYLSWASYFYKGCYERDLQLGHAIYIAGPVACGKTFGCRKILGAIVGGFSEAAAHLLGETTFNSQLFDHALHVVDDTAVTENERMLRRFSENVKKNTANNERECNEKFRLGGVVGSRARTHITSNLDADAVLHPDLDASMADKVMMFMAQSPKKTFPPAKELDAILARELPWFCRFLFDWVVPPQCVGTSQDEARFGGIKAYHNPEMVTSAQRSSKTSALAQVLIVWMREYFTKTEPEANNWVGCALDLYQQFQSVAGISEVLRQMQFPKFNRDLHTLSKGKLFKIEERPGVAGVHTYSIDRSTHYPKNLRVLDVPEQRTDSRFQKNPTNEQREQQ